MIEVSPSEPGQPVILQRVWTRRSFDRSGGSLPFCQGRFIGGVILVDAPPEAHSRLRKRRERNIRDFQFFITDSRYTVPTLAFVTAEDEHYALEQAIRVLGESPNHLSVEVREGDALLFTLAANPEQPPARA